ncbi:MAG: hypothetical protein AB8I08_08460 [Sandaracinaceae bacterium]
MAQTDRRLERFGLPLGISLAAAGVYLALNDGSLLDWDTYQRLRFIEHYRADAGPDTHVLYHLILRGLIGLGLSPLQSVFFVTAASWGLFLVTASEVARARGLAGAPRLMAVIVVAVASPGLIALVLSAEDNVAYFAPLLLAFHLLTHSADTERAERTRGSLAGILLAIALLLNVTVLLYLVTLPLALVCMGLGQRRDAVRLGLAGGTMLVVYYLAYLTAFRDVPIAMHAFLPRALGLQDFDQSRAPLLSTERVAQYLGGLRAIALTPTLYRMTPPHWVATLATAWAPAALCLAYVALLVRAWHRVRGTIEARRWLAPAALAGLAFVFPYFYEPVLIERWDWAWLWLYLGLISTLRSRPRAGAEVVLALVIAVHAGGALLVVSHHFQRRYEHDEESDLRALVDSMPRDTNPMVLPAAINRHHLAYIAHRRPSRRLFLIGDDAGVPQCVELRRPLLEQALPCATAMQAVDRADAPFIDVAVGPDLLRRARSAVDASE